jgi:phospholipase C
LREPDTTWRSARSPSTVSHRLLRLPQQSGRNDGNVTTPIKHVIVIITENCTFDHIFVTHKPKNGNSVWNLLSQGAVDEEGSSPHSRLIVC